jgi:hypothetical protein
MKTMNSCLSNYCVLFVKIKITCHMHGFLVNTM